MLRINLYKLIDSIMESSFKKLLQLLINVTKGILLINVWHLRTVNFLPILLRNKIHLCVKHAKL